ncbi:MAG: segregation/condensation protein A [Candidatus Azambacteria bacterium]|nr:segregation/condensation protein A [Candidatus Azambacteria bacterium]
MKLEKFEGPLELLLELIEKERLDISDISLARITDEFVAYFSQFQEKDPSYLADFLVIAAKLILIKSKTLLPSFAVTKEEEQEFIELKDRLVQYQHIRAAAHALGVLEREQHIAYHKPSDLRHIRVFAPPADITTSTVHVLFGTLIRSQKQEEQLEEKRIAVIVSFEERIRDIRSRIEQGLTMSFSTVADASSKVNMIVSFLAMLELVRQKFCEAEQECVFGEIKIAKLCQ